MDEDNGADYSGVSEFGKLMFWIGVFGLGGFIALCMVAGGN